MADTLPNGLNPPAGLPPPQLPGGLNVPPDLPHPQVFGPSVQLPPPVPSDPMSAFSMTPEIHAMAKAAAPHIGVDPMNPPETPEQKAFDIEAMKRLPPSQSTLGYVAPDPLASIVGAAAATPYEIGKSIIEAPGYIESQMKELSTPYGRTTPEAAIPLAAQTAMALAGSRVFGGAPEEGLTLGAGPGRGPTPPKPPEAAPEKYVFNAPPPRTQDLPPAEGLKEPYASWHARVADLDQRNSPDTAYRTILSAGSKDMKANGAPKDAPTWRDKMINVINKNLPEAQTTPKSPEAAAFPEEHIASFTGREAPTIVRSKKVPYLAGSSNDGSTVYIDPRVPKEMDVGAPQPIDPSHPLAVHEGVEHNLMLKGVPYESAHRVALGEERQVVEGLGGDWNRYQDQMHKLAEQTEKEPVKPADLPSDLYEKPYAHTELAAKVQAAEKPTAAPVVTQGIAAGKPSPEPPVPSDHVRFYHGSYDQPPFNEGRWLTPQHDYARNYGQGDRNVSYVDIPKDKVPVAGWDENTGRPRNFNADAGLAQQLKPLKPLDLGQTVQSHIDTLRAQQNAARAGTPPAPPGQPPPPPSAPITPGGGGPPREGSLLPARPTAQTIRSIEDDLHTIRTRDAGRRDIAYRDIRRLKGVTDAETNRNVFHAREQDRVGELSPRAQQFNRDVIDPLHQATTVDKNEIRRIMGRDSGIEPEELNDPNYMPRKRIGTTPGMDEATGLGDVVGYRGRGGMAQEPPSLRGRSIFAMEDEAGNRKVVTAYPGGDGVYSWQGGKFRIEPGSFIRTKPGEPATGETQLGRTTLERPVPARAEMQPQVEGKKQGALTKAYTKPEKELPDRIVLNKATEPKLLNDTFRPGSEFVDMNNKRWLMKQATVQEIHDAGVRSKPQRYYNAEGQPRMRWGEPIRFHEDALGSEITDRLQSAKALDTARFVQKWENSPEFKRYSVDAKDANDAQRADWVPIAIRGWENRRFDPRFAEPFNDYLNGAGWRIPYLDRLSNVITKSYFATGIGSIAHFRNEQWQRFQARGWGNLNPVSRVTSFRKAWDETVNKGPIWEDYRNRGASFPSDRMHWNSIEQQVMKTLGAKMATDPGIRGFARRMGLTSHDGANALEYGIGKAVFKYGDFIALQHGLELERRGFTRDQAIQRMNRVLPTYRMPSRVGTQGELGRGVSKVLGSPSLTMFGRFEYTKFKGISSIVEDMLGSKIAGRTNMQERWDAVGRAAAIATAIGVFGPMVVNPILQRITGDKNAHMLFGGSIGMLARFARTIDDVIGGKKNWLEGAFDALSVTNIAPLLKEGMQQIFNQDLFTGQPITGKNISGTTDLIERLGHALPQLFNPAEALQDPGRYFVKGPLGVSTAKPFSTAPRTLGQARREAFANARTFSKVPGPLQSVGRFIGGYGGTQ